MIIQFVEPEGKKPYFILYYFNPDSSKHTEERCNIKAVYPANCKGTYWDCDKEVAFEEDDILVPDLMLVSKEFFDTL